MKYSFQKFYWGTDKHTSVLFRPFSNIPKNLTPTVSMVFIASADGVLLVKASRGWGLPGGHIEKGETPVQCAIREVYEEACVKVGSLKLVGGWITKKELQTDDNSAYPDNGAMLLYTANVVRIDPFQPDFETSERKFVNYRDIPKIHDGRSDFYEVSRYVVSEMGY